jgi:hypothetical protein
MAEGPQERLDLVQQPTVCRRMFGLVPVGVEVHELLHGRQARQDADAVL